jgi:hypothetical protein
VDRSDKFFAVLVIVGLAAAGFLAVGRARIESRNRTVEIIVDGDDVRQLSMAAGLSSAETLNQLRTAGATALALREVTVGELTTFGEVLVVAMPGAVSLVSTDPTLLSSLAVALHSKLPKVEIGIIESQTPAIVLRGVTMDQLAKVPVMLRRDDLQAARAANLRVVARLMNFPAASPGAIDAAARTAKSAGAKLVVFREDQVLGWQDLLPDVASAFDRSGLLYGYIEIVNQKGGDALASKLPHRLIRVHSVTDADMQTLSPDLGVSRYARAVEERNIRACYVRLILRPQKDPMEANARYVATVVNALRDRDFRIGPPAPFTAPEGWPPEWARLLCLLALPAALVLLVRRLAPLRAGAAWLVFLSVLVLGSVIALGARSLIVPLSGLAAACILPTLALVWAMQWSRGTGLAIGGGRMLGRALLGLLVTSAITFAGALLIVGLYSPVRFLEGIGLFSGVKLAYVAPLLLAFIAVAADLPGRREPLRQWWTRAKLQSIRFFGQPITLALGIALVAAVGALAFAVMRSGNQPAVAPTGIELKLRNLLEAVLYVRPRTKEFLLGHPALMLAIALSLRGRRAWLPLVVVLAGIGQISLLNTYCHFHSPLHVSLVRTANGLWVGAIVGMAVLAVWRALFDRYRRPAVPAP